jgi:hypothetical protein
MRVTYCCREKGKREREDDFEGRIERDGELIEVVKVFDLDQLLRVSLLLTEGMHRRMM